MIDNDLQNVHVHVYGVPFIKGMKKVCRPCCLGKCHKLPFQGRFERAKQVGDILPPDIIGPMVSSFPKKFQFVNDHSRYAVLGVMVHRSEIFKVFSGVKQNTKQLGK